MNYALIQLIMTLTALIQNPSVPVDVKIQVYKQSLPIIEKYMDEVKNEEKKEVESAVEDQIQEQESNIKLNPTTIPGGSA